jgi:hypothetical protein
VRELATLLEGGLYRHRGANHEAVLLSTTVDVPDASLP